MPTTSPAAASSAVTLPLFLPKAPADKIAGLSRHRPPGNACVNAG